MAPVMTRSSLVLSTIQMICHPGPDGAGYGDAEQLCETVDGHGHAEYDEPDEAPDLELRPDEGERDASDEERDVYGEAPGADGHFVPFDEQGPLRELVAGRVISGKDDTCDRLECRIAGGHHDGVPYDRQDEYDCHRDENREPVTYKEICQPDQ